MLALHCVWTAEGEVVLWAEDSELPARRPGRAPRGAVAHPFAVGGDELARRLGVAADTRVVRLLLPSYASAPLASPTLVRDPMAGGSAGRGTVRLRPWLVPGVRVDPVAWGAVDGRGGVGWLLAGGLGGDGPDQPDANDAAVASPVGDHGMSFEQGLAGTLELSDAATLTSGRHSTDPATPTTGTHPTDTTTPTTGTHPTDTTAPTTGRHSTDPATPATGTHPTDTTAPTASRHPTDATTRSTGTHPSDADTLTSSGHPADPATPATGRHPIDATTATSSLHLAESDEHGPGDVVDAEVLAAGAGAAGPEAFRGGTVAADRLIVLSSPAQGGFAEQGSGGAGFGVAGFVAGGGGVGRDGGGVVGQDGGGVGRDGGGVGPDGGGLADVRPGVSVRFLGQVLGFVDGLVGRGRVLPALVREGRGVAGRWRPVLGGADAAGVARLGDLVPPVVRAEQVGDVVDGRGADEVVREMVDVLVDRRVRVAVGGLAPGPVREAEAAAGALLTALTGEPLVVAPAEQVRRLARQLDAWRGGAGTAGPVRVCFRLRSPGQEREGEWAVEFLLQAADDPSVLVSAADVWGGRGSVLHRWVEHPDELLLTELGRAARVVPELDGALREARPTGLSLDVGGAYAFLARGRELDQAGFGVLLPSWWRPSSGVGLRLTTTSAAAGVVSRTSALGRDELVDFRWELAVGDLALTEGELRELAGAKVPLVRLRGQWVHLDQRGLAAGLAFLERAGSGRMSAGDVVDLVGLPADDAGLPLPVVGIGGSGWLADLLSGAVASDVEPVDPPEGFTAELRPYQRRGLAWLAFLDRMGLGACLADDMGLGKTVQLLALEALCRAAGPRPPTLLVCPMSVVGSWQREAERFTPGLRVRVHHGAGRGDVDADLVITTYAVAVRDAEALAAVEWDRVVLDEAQNIKNSASRQSRAVRSFPARHRVALTGTPVENRLAELWSIVDFTNPGLLGTLARFRARFAVPVERHGDEEAAARLRRVTGPFVLRRLKTDPTIIADLPEKVEMKQLCNLTAEQASLYRAVVDDMLAKVDESDGVQRKGLVLATMTKLKQVCNHPAQFLGDGSRVAGRSGKLARLEDTVEELLAEGDKALCFTQFAAFGGMLVPYLSARFDTEVLFLHGGTPKRQRDAMVERFQDVDGPRLLLLSLKAGGTGLTLTAANHVIHLDRWWNPAVEDQATDRAFRIGQRRDVQVRKFVCVGTLEERVDAMIEQKKALARMVVGPGEDWLTELSTAELRELVALSSEAVGA